MSLIHVNTNRRGKCHLTFIAPVKREAGGKRLDLLFLDVVAQAWGKYTP